MAYWLIHNIFGYDVFVYCRINSSLYLIWASNKLYCLLHFCPDGLVFMCASLGAHEGYIPMFLARICFSLILTTILTLNLLCTKHEETKTTWKRGHCSKSAINSVCWIEPLLYTSWSFHMPDNQTWLCWKMKIMKPEVNRCMLIEIYCRICLICQNSIVI
jgi:hypothetical protein